MARSIPANLVRFKLRNNFSTTLPIVTIMDMGRVPGFFLPSEAGIKHNDIVTYAIEKVESNGTVSREIGRGRYDATNPESPMIVRTTCLISTNGNAYITETRDSECSIVFSAEDFNDIYTAIADSQTQAINKATDNAIAMAIALG